MSTAMIGLEEKPFYVFSMRAIGDEIDMEMEAVWPIMAKCLYLNSRIAVNKYWS